MPKSRAEKMGNGAFAVRPGVCGICCFFAAGEQAKYFLCKNFNMVARISAYDETTDLMVSIAPEKLASYRVSEPLQRQYDELVEKEELDTILIINHLLYLAKLKAVRLSAAA